MKQARMLLILFYFSLLISFSNTSTSLQTIETNYGSVFESENVIHELLEHPMFKRLKKIHQYGIAFYTINDYDFDRYEHSVGVYALLKRFGASRNEQIAGLLHDVSHTAFSHVGDHFFKRKLDGDSYQDEIHEWFLTTTGFDRVLQRYGITIREVLHKNKQFTCLEQELPNICADRLEYILRGGVLENKLDENEVNEILDAIRFENDSWFFVDVELAKKFARVSLYLTENLFASAVDMVANEFMASMLHRAISISLLNINDIHFGCDDEIWYKLANSEDEIIKKYLAKLHNLEKSFEIGTQENYNLYIKCKFRGVDPIIKTACGLKRLTAIDEEYQKEYIKLQDKIKEGLYLLIK